MAGRDQKFCPEKIQVLAGLGGSESLQKITSVDSYCGVGTKVSMLSKVKVLAGKARMGGCQSMHVYCAKKTSRRLRVTTVVRIEAKA